MGRRDPRAPVGPHERLPQTHGAQQARLHVRAARDAPTSLDARSGSTGFGTRCVTIGRSPCVGLRPTRAESPGRSVLGAIGHAPIFGAHRISDLRPVDDGDTVAIGRSARAADRPLDPATASPPWSRRCTPPSRTRLAPALSRCRLGEKRATAVLRMVGRRRVSSRRILALNATRRSRSLGVTPRRWPTSSSRKCAPPGAPTSTQRLARHAQLRRHRCSAAHSDIGWRLAGLLQHHAGQRIALTSTSGENRLGRPMPRRRVRPRVPRSSGALNHERDDRRTAV